MTVDRIGVHSSHCWQGEEIYGCKYGDKNCPATPKIWPHKTYDADGNDVLLYEDLTFCILPSHDDEPAYVITHKDGSTVRMFRSKTDPHAYLPIQDDGTVVNWVERFSNVGRKNHIS